MDNYDASKELSNLICQVGMLDRFIQGLDLSGEVKFPGFCFLSLFGHIFIVLICGAYVKLR
jgi:hypothetical protein